MVRAMDSPIPMPSALPSARFFGLTDNSEQYGQSTTTIALIPNRLPLKSRLQVDLFAML
jgi:hypothetical protein